MAFDIDYIAKGSTSGNTQALNSWNYNASATGTNEAIATVIAAGYFNAFMQNLTTGDGPLQIGDVINIRANDANGMYMVSDVTTNVEVVSYSANGSVGTANIQDGAVTTAKIADGDVTSAKLEPGLVHYARVSVALADFIASNTTPVEILAAPGANLKYVLHRAALTVDYGGTVLAAGGTVQLAYGTAAGVAGAIATTNQAAATLIAATADTMLGFEPVETTLLDSLTVNEPVSLTTETADFTGGTGSTYEVDVWYSIVPI